MEEERWSSFVTLLNLIKEQAFPLITPILCKPVGADSFMIFASNHGLFLDLSMTNNCTVFDVYELEDLLKWKYQIPKIEHISLLREKNRIIALKDDKTKMFIAYMNGRKVTFFDTDLCNYVFVKDVVKNQADKFYTKIVNIDGGRIDNLEDFMDSSFIPEDEEIYLLEDKLDSFYQSVNNRMIIWGG